MDYYQKHHAEGNLAELDQKIVSAQKRISVLQDELKDLKKKREFATLKLELQKVSTPTTLTVRHIKSDIE